jgi:hypothetical protein
MVVHVLVSSRIVYGVRVSSGLCTPAARAPERAELLDGRVVHER